jgi:lipopolysaccharide export system protein LptA
MRAPFSALRLALLLAVVAIGTWSLAAQPATATAPPADNRKLVEIIHTDYIKSMSYNGKNIDRFIGNVELMHNGALMSCDSAYRLSSSEYEAYGRVVIIQNSTQLFGDWLHYDGATNVAQVRGTLVRLIDSTATLRTQHLDFNTKDNIGHFFNGGTLANNGSLLESIHGFYYANDKRFVFNDSIEIHNETYDIKCEAGEYNTRTDIATFTAHTNIWHNDGFLACDYGWYDKKRDYFYFSKNAYIQSTEQEIWADSVYYDRRAAKGDLYGNVQMLDTVQQSIAFGDEAHFFEDPQRVTLTRQPSVAYYTNDDNRPDTLFIRADTLRFITEPNPALYPKDTIVAADSLAANVAVATDSLPAPITDTIAPPLTDSLPAPVTDTIALSVADSLPVPVTDTIAPPLTDSLPAPITDTIAPPLTDSLPAPLTDTIAPPLTDSLPVPVTDTIAPPLTDSLPSPLTDTIALSVADSTTVAAPAPDSVLRKVFAHFNVRAFRHDVQAVCDSFAYSSLDSLGRMFGRPVMWNEQQQISSKEIHFLSDPKKKKMIRADFLESAFIITHEQDSFYNQVKGRDIIGHFRNNDIYRIDVLGGAQTVYYLQEDSLVANGNLAESATMQIEVQKRKIRRIKYYDQPVIDTYPLDQLPPEKATLKGFEWRDAERPKSRWEVCTGLARPTQRPLTRLLARPTFPITKRFDHEP